MNFIISILKGKIELNTQAPTEVIIAAPKNGTSNSDAWAIVGSTAVILSNECGDEMAAKFVRACSETLCSEHFAVHPLTRADVIRAAEEAGIALTIQ